MTRLDEIIANALAGIPETDVAILAREVVRLRGEQAVVVPEIPMGTALQRLGLRLTQILDGHEFAVLEHEFLNPAIKEMQKLSVLSDRGLGEGVVVPELTTDDAHRELLRVSPGGTYSAVQEDSFRDGYDFARTRAIPSDRVLEDGMVAMSAIKRKCQNDDEDAIETLALCGYGEQAELLEAAIRANQGGADHA